MAACVDEYDDSALWCPGTYGGLMSAAGMVPCLPHRRRLESSRLRTREKRMHRTGFAAAALIAAPVAATIAGGATAAPGATAAQSITLGDFLTGLACTESSGYYTALNERTGAYGKYQVM